MFPIRESDIIEQIFRTAYRGRFKVEEAIIPVVSPSFDNDQIEAEAFAEREKRKIWKRIVQRIDEESSKGLFPTIEIVDPTRFELGWYPERISEDNTRMRRLKLKLARRGEILNQLDDIDDRKYEALGCLICQFAGAPKWYLTPRSNDWGIDFLALVPVFGKAHLFPSIGNQLRIVGQCKKWQTPVPRERIEILANKIEDIRRRNSIVLQSLPSWFIDAEGPLVGCMIAHKGVQSGGHIYARDHGIIVSDRRDIAEIICLSKNWKVGVADTPNTRDFLLRSIEEILPS